MGIWFLVPIGTGTSKWFRHFDSESLRVDDVDVALVKNITAPFCLGGLFKVYKGGARQAWEVPMGGSLS